MVKILALNIIKWEGYDESRNIEPVILSTSTDLSDFGFFQRSSVSEFVTFISRLLAKRTNPGERQQVIEKGNMCYAHSRVNGICCVLITDSTYPPRVAFSVVMQALLEYEKSVPSSRWKTDDLTDDCLHLKAMDTLLTKYQNPTEADDLLKVKSDLEETTTLMNQCLDNVLKKGEKMDDLVGKSDDLSFHSKAFYNGAKDQNSCCSFQ